MACQEKLPNSFGLGCPRSRKLGLEEEVGSRDHVRSLIEGVGPCCGTHSEGMPLRCSRLGTATVRLAKAPHEL
jgi:hypothetical protein